MRRPALLVPLFLLPAGAAAQERPLRTVDPVPEAAGRVRVEVGAEWLHDRSFPLSGLSGDLVTLPALGFSIGFGRAELRIDGGLDLLWIDGRDPSAPFAGGVEVDGDFVHDTHDPVVATKVLLRHETARQPAVGVRLATKLPSAANKKGIGTDAMDFYLAVLAGKDVGRTRLAANVGLGILSIPEQGERQNDVLVYGLSAVRRVGGRLEIAGEIAGREDLKGDTPAGTEDLGEARVGARWSAGRWRLDAAAIVGLNEADAAWGATLGVTTAWQTF